MIALGLRLAVGSRSARTRLALVATGVALGSVLLLGALGYQHARSAANHRVGVRERAAGDPRGPGILWAVAPVGFPSGRAAYTLIRTAPGRGPQPAPLGAPRMPSPGTAYVSPAVAALMGSRAHGAVWRALVPWRVVGTLGRAALHDPNDRVVLAGVRHEALAAPDAGAGRVASWGAVSRRVPASAMPAYELIPFAMTVALSLTPIAIFVAAAAGIGQRRRDERASALRLLGASARQLAFVAAAETALGGLVGSAAGVAAIELMRLRDSVSVGSYAVFTADAVPPAWQLAAVLVGMPLFAASTAWVALSRSIRQPLAARRRAAPRVPRGWRVAVPLAGWAVLALVLLHPGALPLTQRAVALGLAGGLVLLGVVLAGGYLVRRGARLLGGLPGPAATIAGRRLEMDPGGGFRAISGVAVALTVTCATLVVGSSQTAVTRADATATGPRVSADVIVSSSGNSAVDRRVVRVVRGVAGVRAAVRVAFADSRPGPRVAVADCRSLLPLAAAPLPCGRGVLAPAGVGRVGAPVTIRFPRGSKTATVKTHIGGHLPAGLVLRPGDGGLYVVPPALEPAGVTPDEADLLVRTSGPAAAARVVGRLNRDVSTSLPVFVPGSEPAPEGSLARLEVLLTAIALVVMGIAAAGLAIGAIEGVLERRRTLAHLAATGVPAGTLRTAAALEVAAPMAAAVVLAVAVGIGTGGTFIHLYYAGTGATPVVVPWARIAALVLAAGGATAGVVALTLPMVGRSIGPEGLRTE